MKRKLFLFVIIGLGLFSCIYENEPENFSTGFEDKFRIGTDYQLNHNSLKFKITEIVDSRCPSDVVCIWAGKAEVKINVESPVSRTFVLSNPEHKIDTVGSYSFELIEVSPYPVSTRKLKTEEYIVTLKITDLNN